MILREGEELVKVNGQEFVRTCARAKLSVVPADQVQAVAGRGEKKVDPEYYWQDGVNPDLVFTQFILDSEGDNKNWDYMPRPSLLASYATAKFKPFDVDHAVEEEASLAFESKDSISAKNSIYGVMTSSALANSEGKLLTEKQIKALATTDVWNRKDDDKVCVVGYAAMWNFLFPKTVQDVLSYASQGVMHVSMERWIRKYDFLYRDKDGNMQAIAKDKAEVNGYHEAWAKHQTVNDYPIWRRSLQFVYGGVASTMIPANNISTFIPQEPDITLATASEECPGLKILINRHNEVHSLYALSSDEGERTKLRAEHEWLHKCIASFRR